MNDADGVKQPMGSATSFTAGVYMRINPSFLIKKILIITFIHKHSSIRL